MIKELLLITLILSQGLPLFHFSQQNYSQLPPSQFVTVSIVEKPQNLETLQLYVQEHKVLSKEQVESMFIPTARIDRLVQYLQDRGIKTSVYMNVITATGTVSQIEKALGGSFYVEKFHNLTFYQYTGSSSPLLSNAIVFSTNVTTSLLERPSSIINITQAVAFSQVSPSQLREAYNVTPLLAKGINGTNVTIGLVDFYGDPYIQQQLKDFDSNYNISAPPFFLKSKA